MTDQVSIDVGPASFNSDGTTDGGTNVAGEQNREAQAGGEAQAPQRTPSQEQSARVVTELRAKAASEKLSPKEMARLHQHSLWRDGLTHLEPLENRTAQVPDTREVDSLRTALEAETQTISKQDAERVLAKATVNGLPPDAGQLFVELSQHLGLDHAATATLVERATKHHAGGQFDDAQFHALNQDEIADILPEAARIMGGVEKLQEVSAQVERFLQAKGMLDILGKAGVLDSSLSLDPRILYALKFAADRAGIK